MASWGLRGIKTIRDFDLFEKNVFLRLDLNVPMDEAGKITDENRIVASLPTIQYAISQGARLVIASHLGRPKNRRDTSASLAPVGQRLSELLGKEVLLLHEPLTDSAGPLMKGLRKDQIVLLENLRYDAGETENSEAFAQNLESFTEIYINDAFGACHRAHASIEALPRMIRQKGIGFLIEKEVQMLDQLIHQPKKPFVCVLGGAKVSDKIGVIEKLIDQVDVFIIGGAMAYTFLQAKDVVVGKSLVEREKLNYCRQMFERLEARNKSILLPVDHIAAGSFSDTEGVTTPTQAMTSEQMGLDIGPKTIKNFEVAIKNGAMIFWNGPMGVFEKPAFSKGTFAIAKAMSESSGIKIVGGGDSAAAVAASGYSEKMTHISTGGGASLEYLQGDRLPGLEVLREKQR